MNRLYALIAALLAVFVLAGCGIHNEPIATDTGVTLYPQTEPEFPHTLYFPDDEAYVFTQEAEEEELIFLDEIIKTNTTEITIKNTGDTSIFCGLYYPENMDDFILSQTIEPGKTRKFTGLTSALNYCIGFQLAEDGTIEVKITG